MTLNVDGSDLVWYSNYTVNWTSIPDQLDNQTANVSFTPQTLINLEPNQTKTITVFFPDFDCFQFSSHTIQFSMSQNRFGDIINDQTLTVPQTMVYLKIANYSQIETDENAYGSYYNATLKETMVTLEHPNFYQRYVNFSIFDFYPGNAQLMAAMGILGITYFNVTVINNSTFSVTNVSLYGSPLQYPFYGLCGGAKPNLVLEPNDTLLFPIGQSTIPSNGYVTGYIVNNSTSTTPTPTPSPTSTPATNPTATPTATPNLSSAIPDTSKRISISVTALNTAHLSIQWDPIYFVHVTNNSTSSIAVVSIICTAIDDQTNFVFWNGTQILSPNTNEKFSSVNPYDSWPMNDIYVYYMVSGQLFAYSLTHIPLPTYSPAPTS